MAATSGLDAWARRGEDISKRQSAKNGAASCQIHLIHLPCHPSGRQSGSSSHNCNGIGFFYRGSPQCAAHR